MILMQLCEQSALIRNLLESLYFGEVSRHTATTACLRASCW